MGVHVLAYRLSPQVMQIRAVWGLDGAFGLRGPWTWRVAIRQLSNPRGAFDRNCMDEIGVMPPDVRRLGLKTEMSQS